MIQKEKVTEVTPMTFDAKTKTSANIRNSSQNSKDMQENLSHGIDKMMRECDELSMQNIPFFIVRSANDLLTESMSKESPKALWLSLWYEGQICCLFANSGNGKSIYAVQIAASIAQTRKVLYFDFELSEAQFTERYSDDWEHYKFPDNFFRVEINADYLATKGMADVINEIEDTTLAADCDTIIIDNITWIATSTEKAEDAGRLMQRLMALKKIYGWSILLLAHTPKRDKQMPITENDLAGSKVLYNFIDSAFSIGQSQRGDDYRYIIEIKTRRKKNYGKSNVIVTQIVKEDNFTYQKTIGYSTEDAELGTRKNNQQNSDEKRAVLRSIMGNGEWRYTDLVSEITSRVNKSNGESLGERSAKDYIKSALNDGILTKNLDGKYMFSEVVQN